MIPDILDITTSKHFPDSVDADLVLWMVMLVDVFREWKTEMGKGLRLDGGIHHDLGK